MTDRPADASPARPRCLVTGASGYVGGRVKQYLIGHGWSVTELTRRPNPDATCIRFELGDAIDPDVLSGHDALVHCAYDFRAVEWSDIRAKNVEGSIRLMDTARRAGIARIVFISTISAFDGCRSLYGKAKLEIERAARDRNAWSIRPGLVFGEKPGAMFGQLVANVRRSSVLPVPGGGRQPQFLVHETDLAAAILQCLQPAQTFSAAPVTVAHERMWLFGDIIREIAHILNRKVTLVPVPGGLMWAGLRTAEILKIPLGLRSDSLVSLMHQNPAPKLNAREVLGVACRPFGRDLALSPD
jgi:nucleoside-diphosphate-sugar epimerase